MSKKVQYKDLNRELAATKDMYFYCYDRNGTQYTKSEYRESMMSNETVPGEACYSIFQCLRNSLKCSISKGFS